MFISDQTIAEIKNSTNIVDIIGEVVSLSKYGRAGYKGLCPFHNEKTPSFNVNEEKQFYRCFGCGKAGDVFKFIEDYQDVNFQESVKILGERLGMTLEVNTPSSSQRTNVNQPLYDINASAARFYHAILMTTKQGEAARQYLHQRGLSDEIIKTFQIGLSPSESNYLYQAMSKDFDEQTILDSGLFNLSERNQFYDTYRNRIMFPLTNDTGQVIGFSGRVWTEEDVASGQAKYKNSRATKIFNKSRELYHLDKAKANIQKKHEVYMMEGFMDVIAAYRAGINNAVASMGTALTPEHVDHLKRFTKKIILTYDGDDAGQSAIAKALDLLNGFQVEIVRLPDNMDPDDYIKTYSEEALAKLLTSSRISDVEFWMSYLRPSNISNLQSEIEYVEKMAEIIARHPSITAQNTFISKLAEDLPDFDFFQVEQAVNNVRLVQRQQQGQNMQARQQVVRHVELPIAKQVSAMKKTESQLFQRILTHTYLLSEFRNREDFVFETAEIQTLFNLLVDNGEITPMLLSTQPENVQNAYYYILELNLPEEVGDGEIEEIEEFRRKLLLNQEMNKKKKLIHDVSNRGDMEQALIALEELIAQKRRME